MKKTIRLIVFLFLAGTQFCFAQRREVSGRVTDASDGSPVAGATVIIKGTDMGTATDANGRYTLKNVQPHAILVFSFIGMKTEEVNSGTRTVIDVKLESVSKRMEEVMIVAYGTAKKGSFTGAATSLSAGKALKDVPVASFESVLQGSTPGVTVSGVSGQPGAGLNIRIRGTGSMNASNNPLYVIDGVPVISGDIAVSGVSGDSKAFNIMASINPEDIENITILKDAAAASLYGSRAANGVILITTKQGKSGKTSVSFKADYGIVDWAYDNRPKVSGEEYRELTYEAFYNEAVLYKNLSEIEAKKYATRNTDRFAPKLEKYSDWTEALFRKRGYNQKYEVTAQGGNASNSFYVSLQYRAEQGMTDNSNLKGVNARLNASHKSADERLGMGGSLTFSNQKASQVSEGFAYANPWFVVNWYATPVLSIHNDDGSFYEGFPLNALKLPNPLKDQGLDENTSEVLRSNAMMWLSYKLTAGLTIKQTLSYDFIHNHSVTHWPMASTNGSTHKGLMIQMPYQHHNIYSSTVLNFNKDIDKHHVDFLVGWDMDKRHEKYVQAVGKGYASDKLPELINTSEPMTAESNYYDDRLLSALSRLNYDFDNKYYFSANFRMDGSSRLSHDTRWGSFGSLSLAWRVSQEHFFESISHVINEFKLRMSYGVNGTLPKDLYGYLSLFESGYNYQDLPGVAPKNIPNDKLKWEKNYNFNMGFDLRVFDKVGVVFDFYNRNTKDLLQKVPVSRVVGFRNALRNIGAMNNRGFEVEINYDVFNRNDIRWTTALAFSHNKNKITKLYGGKDIIDGWRILREGESYYSWWGREWAGVDSETGEEQWVLNTPDANGNFNKELTKDPSKAKRILLGAPDPKLVGGWRNTLSWKGFDLNFLFSFSLGGKVNDNYRITYTDTDGGKSYYVMSKDALKRWTAPGQKTKVPRRINNYQYSNYGSNRHIYNLNYMRLKTLTLSYSLPADALSYLGLGNARIYVAGNNLLTLTSYKNIDPESFGYSGNANWGFPPLKSVNFGIEITL